MPCKRGDDVLIKIYLNDWFYNIGIIGLIRVFKFLNLPINIKDNYVEFDEKYLDDLPQGYFDYFKNDYQTRPDYKWTSEEEFLKDFKRDLSNNFIGQASFANVSARCVTLQDHVEYFKNAHVEPLKVLLFAYQSGFNIKNKSDVNLILSTYQQQKGYELNSKTEKTFKDAKDFDFCIFCGMPTVGDQFDETSFLPLALSHDVAFNFSWNGQKSMPICKLCSLLFLFAPAGVSEVSYQWYLPSGDKKEEKLKVFINLDTTVDELLSINDSLKNRKVSRDNLFRSLVVDISQYLKNKAAWTLQSILVVEFNAVYREKNAITKKSKVYYFGFPRYLAEFFIKSPFSSDLRKFNDFNFRDCIVDRILKNQNLDELIYEKLFRIVRGKDDIQLVEDVFLTVRIKSILEYYKSLNEKSFPKKGDEMMIYRKLKEVYDCGVEIANYYKKNDQANKLPSVAYKILNASKTGDYKLVMDTIIRVFMNAEKPIPSIFLEIFSPFNIDPDSIIQTFVAGLMSKEGKIQEKIDEEEVNDE